MVFRGLGNLAWPSLSDSESNDLKLLTQKSKENDNDIGITTPPFSYYIYTLSAAISFPS